MPRAERLVLANDGMTNDVQVTDGVQHFVFHKFVVIAQAIGIDFIVLAGFLWKVPAALIQAYPQQIVNIHPALLPKYGGKGMYGHFVHEAVIQNKETESGISIHLVDELYDHGKVVFQATCKTGRWRPCPQGPILRKIAPAKAATRVAGVQLDLPYRHGAARCDGA